MLVSHDAVPDLTDQVLRADQAVKAELFTADRRLIIAGCSYYWPEAYSVAVLPQLYGAAFLSSRLWTVLKGKTDANCTFGPSVKSRIRGASSLAARVGGRDVCKWHFSNMAFVLDDVRS